MSFKKIMVAVDYSSCSKLAYEYAATLAVRFGATLDVVHAWDRPHYVEDDNLVVAQSGGEKLTLGSVLKQTAEEDMEIFLAEVTVPEGLEVNHVVRDGHVVTALVEFAREGGHDLIVTGTHGRSGFKRLVLGSVSERLLRLAPVPVLTVPPSEAAEAE